MPFQSFGFFFFITLSLSPAAFAGTHCFNDVLDLALQATDQGDYVIHLEEACPFATRFEVMDTVKSQDLWPHLHESHHVAPIGSYLGVDATGRRLL